MQSFKSAMVTLPEGVEGAVFILHFPGMSLGSASVCSSPVFVAWVVNVAPVVVSVFYPELDRQTRSDVSGICVLQRWGAEATAIPLGCTRKASLDIVFFLPVIVRHNCLAQWMARRGIQC